MQPRGAGGERRGTMRFCMPHWEKLRAAIDDRGLSHLVSRNGQQAMQSFVKDIEGTADPLLDFDPLLAANNMIWSKALEVGGLSIMAPNEDGTDRCPICWLTAEHTRTCTDPACPQDFERWIEYAADGVKRHVDEQLAARLGETPGTL